MSVFPFGNDCYGPLVLCHGKHGIYQRRAYSWATRVLPGLYDETRCSI